VVSGKIVRFSPASFCTVADLVAAATLDLEAPKARERCAILVYTARRGGGF
jgi:hypothetical protein